jgi:predicted phage tail protein
VDMIEIRKDPALILHPHALVGDGTKCVYAEFMRGETLAKYLERNGVDVPKTRIIVFHNGYRVPDELWTRLIPRGGDQIVIRMASPMGGGGDNKVLNTVAMIALVVVANAYGAALGASLGFSGSMAAGVGTAAIMVGGSMLINSLIPINQSTKINSATKYESSPTYSISGGRNTLRQWQPMPIVFGSHRVAPDWGAAPYTEWIGDKQYFNQIFHFGLQGGNAAISEFKIGDTPIENFRDVQIEVSKGDGKLSMFAGNVDTIQGFVVSNAAGWQSRTTPANTQHISLELAAQLYKFEDNGSVSNRSVDLQVEYRPVGSAEWLPIGTTYSTFATHYWSARSDNASVFSPYGTQYAYGSTNPSEHYDGQFHANHEVWIDNSEGSGYWLTQASYWRWTPHPYAQGKPWYGYAPDPFLYAASGVTMSGAKQEPTRKTISWNVPLGQYEIRVRKMTGDINDSRESNETAVGQILCYQPDNTNYEGQLRVAVRILASEQLQGYIEEFSALVQPYCEVWNGSAWVNSLTRNPAWWLRHFAKGRKRADRSRLYGAGKLDSQIDDVAIKAFAAWCDSKNLKYDFVLDGQRSVGDMLNAIAKVGRGSITTQSGKLGVVWDSDQSPVVAMIAPFNIKAGTFEVAYIRAPDVDEIVGTFTNRDTWEIEEVRTKIPGASITNNPVTLDLEGVTSKEQAGREANLMAASQVFHRRRASWEMDIEHLICKRGDVVLMSHDLTVWGYSGRLVGRDGNKIRVKDLIPSDGTGMMLLRSPTGEQKLVNVASAIGEADEFTIVTDLGDFPLPGDEGFEDIPALDWAIFFDPLETPGRRMKIVSVTPSSDGSAKLSAIDDDPEYYACENNAYQYSPRRDGALLGGVVFSIKFSESIVNVLADINNVQVNWVLSSSATAKASIYINGNLYSELVTTDRSALVQAQTGDVISVTVQSVRASGSGTAKTEVYEVQGLYSDLPTVTGLTNVFRDGITALVWDRVIDLRPIEYEIRVGDSWSNGRVVAIVPSTETLVDGNGLFYVAARYAKNGRVIYGQPDTLRLSGASLVRNVLVTIDEHLAWTGTTSGGAIVHDGELTLKPSGDILSVADVLALGDALWTDGASERGAYVTDSSNVVDIGHEAPVLIKFDIEDYSINQNQDALSAADILAIEDILLGSDRQFYSATPYINTSLDGVDWTGWRKYSPGIVSARFFNVKLELATVVPQIIPFVSRFTWSIDVPDMVQRGENLSIPASGLRVNFDKEFHAIPNIQIAMLNAVSGDYYKLTSVDKTGFNIQLFNGTTAKSMTINWLGQGY